jgi:DNA polymerase gamma 1
MTLQGTKSNGTDMHSVTANAIGISRDNAKVLNYGRIYGAGLKFAKQLLQRFNPMLPDEKAKEMANRMYDQTKGKRKYRLSEQVCNT